MAILITGANGGLGPAVVDAFLAAGETVYGVGRSWKKGNPHNSTSFHSVEADVNTDEGCDTAVSAAAPVTALVHLVGGFGGGQPVQATDDAVFDQMINANLRSAFRIIRAVLPGMQSAKHGRIVVMGSRAGEELMAGFAAYTVAKAGVAALVRTVALENKGSGVTANVLAPSIIDTPANRAAMPLADRSKWVTPESIAKTILWLTSNGAADISGAVIPIYGGA